MNNKKNTGTSIHSNKCPKCSSIVSMDSFEPTCIMCGWVDYSIPKLKKKNMKINLRKFNKAS